MMALNVETKNTTRIALNIDIDEWWLWMPNEDAMMALNAETGNVNRNVKLGSDDDSEHRNRECDSDGSERQNWKYDFEHQFKKWWRC